MSILAWLICAAASGAVREAQVAAHASAAPDVRRAPALRSLNGFVENRGQWADDVLFFAREGGVEATVFEAGLALRPAPELPLVPQFDRDDTGSNAPVDHRMPLLPPVFVLFEHHGHPTAATCVLGENPEATRHNFFQGSRRGTNALGYASLVYRDAAPGIDVVLRTDAGAFVYDLAVAPGADLDGFAIRIDGARAAHQLEPGLIQLETDAGPLVQRIGASWQESMGGGRVSVAASFAVRSLDERGVVLGFEVPNWDRSSQLVIDPSLEFSTFIGGVNQELIQDLAVHESGASYIACTVGAGAPTTPSSIQSGIAGNGTAPDAWIGRLSPDGSALEWGTYLGGAATESGVRLAVGGEGTVVVAGATWSSSFPTTAGSYQPTFAGVDTKSDVFVSRLGLSGDSLVWSTFFGGPDYEQASALGLFPSGDVVVGVNPGDGVAPYTGGPPTTAGAFDPICDPRDKMLIRLSADGAALSFLTYFKTGRILCVEVGSDSTIYLAGDVGALDAPIPTTPGAYKEQFPATNKGEGFVARFNPTGTQLLWATYLGGDSKADTVWGLAVDAAGAPYLCGQTSSPDFPVTPGAFDPSLDGPGYGFVTKLLPNGSGLAWSTFLGLTAPTNGSGYMTGLDVDAAGNVLTVGSMNGVGWPTTPDAFQSVFIGPFPSPDATLAKVSALGESLVYSTWFGGTGTDYLTRVGASASGAATIACLSFAADAPTTPAAYDTTYSGNGDLLLAKFDLGLLPWRVLGGGLKGTKDVPNLSATGDLTLGSPTRFVVRGAAPSSFGWVVAGGSQWWLPLLGGTLVPSPDAFFVKLTSPTGGVDFTLPWPSFGAGAPITFQMWIYDAGAPEQWSATNALLALSQG